MTEIEEIGKQVLDSVAEVVAKNNTEAIVEKIMPAVKAKILEEYGELPERHEVKIGEEPEVKIQGSLPPCFNSVLAYSVNGNPVMLTGHAGTGKGYIARKVAEAMEAKFFEVNAVKNSFDLTGFVDAQSRFVRTPFYDACKTVADGGKAVFLFDEMDCSEPEVLKIFNEALSSMEFTFPNDEHLNFDNLVIISACNTYGTGNDELYSGEQLDASTLDRFVLVKVDYDKSVELSLCNHDEDLVDFIERFRKVTEDNAIPFITSYRSIKRIFKMKDVLPLEQVLKECLVKSMSKDDLESIINNFGEDYTKNVYFRALKDDGSVLMKKSDGSVRDVFNPSIYPRIRNPFADSSDMPF